MRGIVVGIAMSVFRKAAPSHAAGTKPAVFSRGVLTSTGLPDLDAALGGGIALGT